MSVCFYLVLVSVAGEVTLMDVDVHDLERKMVQVLGNPKMRLVGRYGTVMMTRRIVMEEEVTHLWMSERTYPRSW